MYTYKIERLIKAPSAIVWAVISDVESYARHAPNLARAFVISGAGVGMRRRLVDERGAEWDETCTVWDAGREYTMVVDTSTYPYPLRSMQGNWRIEERSDGVLITMQFDYQPAFDLPLIGGWLNNKRFAPAIADSSQKLMDSWVTEIHNRAGY